MTIAYDPRHPVWPGDVGTDVLSYKRALRVLGIPGSGGLIVSGPGKKRYGTTAVAVVKRAQRNHGLAADGKIGPATHAILAPHFDAWGRLLYRSQPARPHIPPPPPLGHETARVAAARLIGEHHRGRYRADNPGDLRDLVATAAGRAVWSAGGYWVHLDHRPIELVLWLIEEGHATVGTFAFCSDHHWDGPHGHSGGFAVDVSSLHGSGIGAAGMHDRTRSAARAIRDLTPSPLRPWQLICGGSGGVFATDIETLCVPSAGFYGTATLAGHRNHIHAGYHGTAGDLRPPERTLARTVADKIARRTH